MKNPIPELEPMLKQLRLSGMLDTLAKRNRDAIEKKLSYTDFLALLVSDEVARRDNKKYTTRLRRAGCRADKTFDQFDFSFNPKIEKKMFMSLASGDFLKEHANILLVGNCGAGKSHLAQAIGHSLVQAGHEVLFTTQSQLSKTLFAARATNTFDRRFQAFAKTPLLIIDDFGLKPFRSPQDEDFHDLIAERYEQASTIVTSNLDFSEWGQAFPNKLLGAATIDRLRHGAYQITLESEKSFRRPRYISQNALASEDKRTQND